jgi:hypothetical protein
MQVERQPYTPRSPRINRRIDMPEPYHHVRFRWWTSVNLDKLITDYSELYKMEKRVRPRTNEEVSLYKDQRDEVTFKADTLSVAAGAVRAVLYQKEAKPFTSKDLALRKLASELYDKTTPTPFPFGFSSEPKFEVED